MGAPKCLWAGGALVASVLLLPYQSFAQERQRSATAEAMLEEVVVTARRREESLQDLPLSVAAVTADAMQAQGIYDISDISDAVPNLSFATTDRKGIEAIFIRGIGNDSTNNLTPVGAGVYIDDHYMPNTLGQLMDTLDVERIEVLRGPQGTLFGKNTTGGAINIITAKPQPEFGAKALLRMADYGQQDFRGMLNVPFTDNVAARFGYAKETQDGYYYNRTLGRDVGASDVEAATAAFRLTPNDHWTIDMSFRANKQRDDNAPSQCEARPTQEQIDNLYHGGVPITMTLFNPQTGQNEQYVHEGYQYTGKVYANEGIANNEGIGQWGGSFTDAVTGNRVNLGGHVERLYPGATIDYWNACDTDRSMGDYVTSYEKETFVDLDNDTFGLTAQWDSAGDIGNFQNLNFKVNASRHTVKYNYQQDRDFSPVQVDAIGTPPLHGFGQQQHNEQLELLLTADKSDRLSFIVGMHFFQDTNHVGQEHCLDLANANIDALADPNSAINLAGGIQCSADGGTQFDRLSDRIVSGGPGLAGMSGHLEDNSEAAFGHVTYDFSDRWTLDVGVRYTTEDRLFNQAETNVPGDLCTHNKPGDNPVTELCVPQYYTLNYENLLVDGFYNNIKKNYSETTPMLSFTRNLQTDRIDNGMVYFLYSEGFLSGSFNDELNPINVPEIAPLLAYGPEHVDNYEIGFKGTLAGGNLQIAGDVFMMKYKDKQVQVSIDNTDGLYGGDPNIGITTNAASVDISGLELELRSSPWNGGYISVDLGYLSDKYNDYTSFDPNAQGGSVDLSNTTIEDYSPEWTMNATVEHQFQLGNGATLTPQLGMYYQTGYDWVGALQENSPHSFCYQPAYSKFRTRITYAPSDQRWQASLYGQNITDERYLERCNDGRRSGAHDYRYGRPVTWGAEFEYRWGTGR
jgi:outer membrane receptor protein involved in Fe transport